MVAASVESPVGFAVRTVRKAPPPMPPTDDLPTASSGSSGADFQRLEMESKIDKLDRKVDRLIELVGRLEIQQG